MGGGKGWRQGGVTRWCGLWFVGKGTPTLENGGRPRDSRAEPNVSPHCRAHCRLWRTSRACHPLCAPSPDHPYPPAERAPAAHIPSSTLRLPAGPPDRPRPHRLYLPISLCNEYPFPNSQRNPAMVAVVRRDPATLRHAKDLEQSIPIILCICAYAPSIMYTREVGKCREINRWTGCLKKLFTTSSSSESRDLIAWRRFWHSWLKYC